LSAKVDQRECWAHWQHYQFT